MAQIRALAGQQGRDPGELGMILRVYPVATAPDGALIHLSNNAWTETRQSAP